MRTHLLAAICLLFAPVVVACSDDNAGGLDNAEGYSVRAALKELPTSAVDGSILIQTGDVTEATELAGATRSDGTEPDAFYPWLQAVTASGKDPGAVFVPIADGLQVQRGAPLSEFEDELGWSISQVDFFVELVLPPKTFTVVSGDFDGDSLAADLTTLDDDVVSAGEGKDLEPNFDQLTTARPTGAPLRLSQRDGRIAFSGITASVAEWKQGGASTLADDDTLVAIADQLDTANVYAAVLSKPETDFGPDEFDAVGFGWNVKDNAAVITLVYHFSSADAAEQAETQLADRFQGDSIRAGTSLTEWFDIDETESKGNLVTITVSMKDSIPPNRIYQMFLEKDLPFAHQ